MDMGIKISDRDMELIKKEMFNLEDPATLPTSFILENKRITGMPGEMEPRITVRDVCETVKEYDYEGRCPGTGLEVKTTVTVYSDYPVYEIRSVYRNIGETETPIVRDILGFDGAFWGENAKLVYNSGEFCSEHGYEKTIEPFTHEMWKELRPSAGRPCDQGFPYFKVLFDGCGLNLAIGWPAQWKAEFGILDGGIRFKGGQDVTCMKIKPGETVIAPRVTVMAYEGDYDRGVNVWRRWYCKYILPKNIKPYLSVSYNGGGREFQESTQENQLEYIKKYADSGIPYTNWWVDAGWYDCRTDLPEGENGRLWYVTGSWYADPERYPEGFGPISEELKKHGMELLLWFEPERVRKDTELYKDHPEWLLNAEEKEDGNCGICKNWILDIGKKDCCDWLIDRVDKLIKDYGIAWYRQDFNFPPLRFWRENETYDRQGAVENQYVQGYLRFWDGILERNPALKIDSCASGGRRNDLETMRRSVPLHPTDYGYGYQYICQAFFRNLMEWLPYTRTASNDWSLEDGTYPDYDHVKNRPADYFTRIATLSPFFAPGFSTEPTEEDFLVTRIWERASKIFVQCDFYPLSKQDKTPKAFYVTEYVRPEEGVGMIQAVRHTQCETEYMKVFLKDVDESATYRFDEMKSGRVIEMSGKDLAENGFDIALEKRGAAVWFYAFS